MAAGFQVLDHKTGAFKTLDSVQAGHLGLAAVYLTGETASDPTPQGACDLPAFRQHN